jgi:integrase
MAFAAGANAKDVSEALGHSDVSTTLRTYTHSTPASRHALSDGVAALLDGHG